MTLKRINANDYHKLASSERRLLESLVDTFRDHPGSWPISVIITLAPTKNEYDGTDAHYISVGYAGGWSSRRIDGESSSIHRAAVEAAKSAGKTFTAFIFTAPSGHDLARIEHQRARRFHQDIPGS